MCSLFNKSMLSAFFFKLVYSVFQSINLVTSAGKLMQRGWWFQGLMCASYFDHLHTVLQTCLNTKTFFFMCCSKRHIGCVQREWGGKGGVVEGQERKHQERKVVVHLSLSLFIIVLLLCDTLCSWKQNFLFKPQGLKITSVIITLAQVRGASQVWLTIDVYLMGWKICSGACGCPDRAGAPVTLWAGHFQRCQRQWGRLEGYRD